MILVALARNKYFLSGLSGIHPAIQILHAIAKS